MHRIALWFLPMYVDRPGTIVTLFRMKIIIQENQTKKIKILFIAFPMEEKKASGDIK